MLSYSSSPKPRSCRVEQLTPRTTTSPLPRLINREQECDVEVVPLPSDREVRRAVAAMCQITTTRGHFRVSGTTWEARFRPKDNTLRTLLADATDRFISFLQLNYPVLCSAWEVCQSFHSNFLHCLLSP